MRTYTEEQLKAAMEYACQHQKFHDYQFAGNCLIPEEGEQPDVETTLNFLCDTDNNDHASIDMADVEEFMRDRRVLEVDDSVPWISFAMRAAAYLCFAGAVWGVLTLVYKYCAK